MQKKTLTTLILIVILLAAILAPIVYWRYSSADSEAPVFFGVSFGGQTVNEAKRLIDKVKNYTNFFLINSWDITTDEAALNEVCDYVVEAKLSFIVFFSYVSRIIHPWHQTWLDNAKAKYGDKFLGVYLFDEPGGNQIDTGGWNENMSETFESVSNYDEAADTFVDSLASINSTIDLKSRNIPMFTSDYALYWFDYLAGYDTVFVELGWNNSRPQQIGLCRGAATVQNKEWGAIITWTHDNPPYLGNGTEILQDMLTAYDAGAKYIVIFNYPTYPEDNQYGILRDEHFNVMQQFSTYTVQHPEDYGKQKGKVALVLPKNYGWGMRWQEDKIWGKWQSDSLNSTIWSQMNILTEKYGLQLDIVYDDSQFNFNQYSEIYYWNSTTFLQPKS